MVLAILTGWIWAKPAVEKLILDHEKAVERVTKDNDRLIIERDKAYEQRDAMAEVFQEKFLPVLSDLIRVVPALQEMISRGEDRGPERRSR